MSKSENKFKHAFMAIASTAILFSQSENTLAAENNPGPDAAVDSVTAPEEAGSSQSSSASNAERPEMDTQETPKPASELVSESVSEPKTPEITKLPEADDETTVIGEEALAEETGTTEVSGPDESNRLDEWNETNEPMDSAAAESNDSTGNIDPTESNDSTGNIDPTESNDSVGNIDPTEPNNSAWNIDSTESNDSNENSDSAVTSEIVEIITILDETEVVTELPEKLIVDLTVTEPETEAENSVSESAEPDITDAAEVKVAGVKNTAENTEEVKDAEITDVTEDAKIEEVAKNEEITLSVNTAGDAGVTSESTVIADQLPAEVKEEEKPETTTDAKPEALFDAKAEAKLKAKAAIKAEANPAEVTAATQPEIVGTPEAETVAESEAATPPADKARAVTADTNGTIPSYAEVQNAMLALKEQEGYTEGTPWTNFEPYGSNGNKGSTYRWKGGPVKGASSGVGCAAFAFILSDEAFGNLPSRTIDNGNFKYEDIKVGDILRINNSHFVIVTQVSPGGVIVAEGNYNKSVHWGRALSKDEVMAANFIVTRYPVGYVSPDSEGADEVDEEGTEGNLRWTLTKSGTGSMQNYSPNDAKMPSWSNYKNVNTIIVEKGVTNIGDYAFYESSALTVHLPDSVSNIGESAFKGSALVNVTLPGSVTDVGNSAFEGCNNLVSASVNEGLRTIGDNAFHACRSLQYIDFPSTIESVGAGAFMSCDKMTRVRFKPGTGDVTFGDNTFLQCWNLMDVTLPQGLTSISGGMFQSCQLLSQIYIPASVTRIGSNPFVSTKIFEGGKIEYGGSETTWRTIGGQFILNAMPKTQFYYNVKFDDPFAEEPNDPGDINLDQDPIQPPEPSGHEHTWASGWTHDTTFHWHECDLSDCPITDNSEKDGYAEHSYGEWVVDTEATADQDGSKHRDCTCGYSETAVIPATGETGGSNNPADPENPDDPDKGDNTGGNTGSPDQPVSPENPEKPGAPDNSGNDKNPDNPDNPGNTGGSGNTGNPDKPADSTNPDNSNRPGKPDDSDNNNNTDKPDNRPGNSDRPTGSDGSNKPDRPAGSTSSTVTGSSHGVNYIVTDTANGRQDAATLLPSQNSAVTIGQPNIPVLAADADNENSDSRPIQTDGTKRQNSDKSKDKDSKRTGSTDQAEQKKKASANEQGSGQSSLVPTPQTTLEQQPNDTSEDHMIRVIVPAACLGIGGLSALYITLRKRRL